MRPQGSPAELEKRRLRAIALLAQGVLPHEVAGRLGSGPSLGASTHREVRAWLARRPQWHVEWFPPICAGTQPRRPGLSLPQVRAFGELRPRYPPGHSP